MSTESFIISQVVSSGEAPAPAQGSPSTEQPVGQPLPTDSGAMQMWLFPLMILVFYFLLIRPQQKKEKQRKAMLKTLSKGDKVVTRGGIWGVIVGMKNDDAIAVVKIADNVKIEVSASAIEAVNPQPAKASDSKSSGNKK